VRFSPHANLPNINNNNVNNNNAAVAAGVVNNIVNNNNNNNAGVIVAHHGHYAIEVIEECSPVIDHCIIHSNSVGMLHFYNNLNEIMLAVGSALSVKRYGANPLVRHCTIVDCENVGIYITDQAQVCGYTSSY
jgi:hypothetical protein